MNISFNGVSKVLCKVKESLILKKYDDKEMFKMKRLSLNDMKIIYLIECKSKLKSQKAKAL